MKKDNLQQFLINLSNEYEKHYRKAYGKRCRYALKKLDIVPVLDVLDVPKNTLLF